MIQVVRITKKDFPKIVSIFLAGNYQLIPKVIESTKQYILPQEINEEIKGGAGISIQRKAYIVDSLIPNDCPEDTLSVFFEQKVSQTSNQFDGRMTYLSSKSIFVTRNQLFGSKDLYACQVVKTLINNHIQSPNIKCNLYGLGLIDDKEIRLRQLLVFETVHFSQSPSSLKNLSIHDFIKTNFVPRQRPFFKGG